MRKNGKLVGISLLLFPAHAFACAAGYFAPTYLDVTDPVIGTGFFLLLIATIINFKRKLNLNAIVMPMVFLAVSYYGHWNYVGDCGYEIVFLNRIAAIVALTWLVYELAMYYRFCRKALA